MTFEQSIDLSGTLQMLNELEGGEAELVLTDAELLKNLQRDNVYELYSILKPTFWQAQLPLAKQMLASADSTKEKLIYQKEVEVLEQLLNGSKKSTS